MKVRGSLAPSLMLAVFATACGGGGGDASKSASPAPVAQTAPAVAAGEFGVPECDRYWTKHLACIDGKVPEASRAMMRQSLDQTKVQWKQAAATEQGRAGLAAVCMQAEAATKQAMTVYGCSW